MVDTARQKGGFARAAALSPEQRSQQASVAASARWSAKAREVSRENAIKLHVGASRIRDTLLGLNQEQRITIIELIWPQVSKRLARLIARYPGEIRVNGAYLILPESWLDEDINV